MACEILIESKVKQENTIQSVQKRRQDVKSVILCYRDTHVTCYLMLHGLKRAHFSFFLLFVSDARFFTSFIVTHELRVSHYCQHTIDYEYLA